MGHHRLFRLSIKEDGIVESIREMRGFDNLGPLVDITVAKFDKYSEAILCSGKNHDGSIKIFRKGI
jgi:hypothetical protein